LLQLQQKVQTQDNLGTWCNCSNRVHIQNKLAVDQSLAHVCRSVFSCVGESSVCRSFWFWWTFSFCRDATESWWAFLLSEGCRVLLVAVVLFWTKITQPWGQRERERVISFNRVLDEVSLALSLSLYAMQAKVFLFPILWSRFDSCTGQEEWAKFC
jgi:hypothetical protein